MRRQASGDISSFDMLLDTMCNTFGGIVFIALLLSILSGTIRRATTADAESPTSAADVVSAIELATLNRKAAEADAAAIVLQASAASRENGTDSAETNLEALNAQNERVRKHIAELTATNAARSRAVLEAEKQLTSVGITIEDVQDQLARIREDLLKAKSQATIKVRLPRLHEVTGLQPAFLALHDGRLFAISDISTPYSTDESRGFDERDVDVENGPSRVDVELREDGGQYIQPGCERTDRLAAALRNLDPRNELVSFSVSTNSFSEFLMVKALFVGQGFAYSWHIREHNGDISIVSRDSIHAQ